MRETVLHALLTNTNPRVSELLGMAWHVSLLQSARIRVRLAQRACNHFVCSSRIRLLLQWNHNEWSDRRY